MVNSVSNSNPTSFYAAGTNINPANQPANNLKTPALQQPSVDEFVTQLEKEHKKAIVKKNILGGSVVGASLLAMIGGALAKSKLGRIASIAPLALTTLIFGTTTLLKGNKMPDYKGMINDFAQQANTQAN